MAILGTGIGITYQSGLLAEILDYSWDGMERAVIETSNFATTGGRTYMPGTLYDPGTIDVEILFDAEIDPTTALTAAAETVTVTYSDAAPASTMAASGFMSGLTITGTLEDRVTARASIKLSGAITHG